MPRYTFINVSAGGRDSLDVNVTAKVVDAENEEEAWSQVVCKDEELDEEEKEDSNIPRKGVNWYRDHDLVTIIELIPDKPGTHSLAYETNG